MFTILPQSAFSSPRDRQVAVDNVNKLDLTTLLNIMLGFYKKSWIFYNDLLLSSLHIMLSKSSGSCKTFAKSGQKNCLGQVIFDLTRR